MTSADHAEPQLRATSVHEIITTAETEGAGGKVMIARIPSSEKAVDDFVAGEIPLKQYISTRFNTVGRNSLNHKHLKVRQLQARAICDLQAGALIFVFNNLQGEHLMLKQVLSRGHLVYFQ